MSSRTWGSLVGPVTLAAAACVGASPVESAGLPERDAASGDDAPPPISSGSGASSSGSSEQGDAQPDTGPKRFCESSPLANGDLCLDFDDADLAAVGAPLDPSWIRTRASAGVQPSSATYFSAPRSLRAEQLEPAQREVYETSGARRILKTHMQLALRLDYPQNALPSTVLTLRVSPAHTVRLQLLQGTGQLRAEFLDENDSFSTEFDVPAPESGTWHIVDLSSDLTDTTSDPGLDDETWAVRFVYDGTPQSDRQISRTPPTPESRLELGTFRTQGTAGGVVALYDDVRIELEREP